MRLKHRGSALVLLHLPHIVALKLTVTGAAGYLGAEIACRAAEQGHEVRAVVRPHSSTEHLSCAGITDILTVEDLCQPSAARDAADGADAVIHAASVFQQCDDMEHELVRPNIELAEQMVCACAAANARLVLTSSMAAVRGTGQIPHTPPSYTSRDWNTQSQRDGGGFEPYQYSKAASERQAWELSRRLGGDMVALCPSMIFGPPRSSTCTGFSVGMVEGWVLGKAPVQSRLVVDVRDCAQAHLAAAELPQAVGRRYITSCEARVPARELMAAVQHRLRACGRSDVADRVTADDDFDGGAILIGEREVHADADMAELGVCCRPNRETLADMVEVLVARIADAGT